MSSAARALVAGHGDFASGMVSAVGQITGRADLFTVLSNKDRSAAEVLAALRELAGDGVRVIFTDLPAGSCAMAARRLQRERPGLVVVTGTNLATLLDFVFAGDPFAGEAARHAAEKGRLSLTVTGGEGA